ncbi:hypothetical protein B0F90DRAFT_361964 [Multifurca ochricompacta]|uniref:F-box domain-containing protein n=1 Tax=Multifurca ochricompacta TaxID=376703 RepID=A0AAD4M428_9AGAM|nr:hypothetical protein B0F90DRAFT_361964 [Multifurca ochricompacta]
MIQTLPPEILCHIFHYACVDQGRTARSLSLTSKYISSVSSRFLYNTLYIPGVDKLERVLHHFSSLPPYLRQVCHLFVADGNDGNEHFSSKLHPDHNYIHIPSGLFSQILLFAAPTLRTLTVVVRTGIISGILECITSAPLHCLADLTLSFNHTRIAVPPNLQCTASVNLPQLRHLHINIYHVLSTTVAPAVALVASQAPRLTSLHVSDVLLIPGCASVLARMLGRLPLQDESGWVLPDEFLDPIMRLPFSVREFAMQVCDGPRTFSREVELVERMANMDYGDGFILLPPTPKRDYMHWKKDWLARVVGDSLEWH